MAYFVETPAEDLLSSLWAAGPNTDLEDSDHYILSVTDAPLLLDDSAEYANLTDYGAIRKEALSTLVEKMLVKLGYAEDEARQKFENCLAFEALLAPAILTTAQQHSPD